MVNEKDWVTYRFLCGARALIAKLESEQDREVAQRAVELIVHAAENATPLQQINVLTNLAVEENRVTFTLPDIGSPYWLSSSGTSHYDRLATLDLEASSYAVHSQTIKRTYYKGYCRSPVYDEETGDYVACSGYCSADCRPSRTDVEKSCSEACGEFAVDVSPLLLFFYQGYENSQRKGSTATDPIDRLCFSWRELKVHEDGWGRLEKDDRFFDRVLFTRDPNIGRPLTELELSFWLGRVRDRSIFTRTFLVRAGKIAIPYVRTHDGTHCFAIEFTEKGWRYHALEVGALDGCCYLRMFERGNEALPAKPIIEHAIEVRGLPKKVKEIQYERTVSQDRAAADLSRQGLRSLLKKERDQLEVLRYALETPTFAHLQVLIVLATEQEEADLYRRYPGIRLHNSPLFQHWESKIVLGGTRDISYSNVLLCTDVE